MLCAVKGYFMQRSFFRNLTFLSVIMALFAFSVSDALAKRRSKRNLVPDPKKYAALVVHTDTGMILHERNADKKRYPASLVKMMTLYLTFDALKHNELSLNKYIRVSANAASQPSLNINLKKGDKIKVRDAIYALVVRSANDAAVALADAISGNEKAFAKKMNKMARKLKMNHTKFHNASGLYHKEQFTTARDMATLLISIQRDFPRYYRYMSRTNFMRKGKKYKTHNKLLTTYKGTTGGKTGYINASGFNLVTAARRRNNHIVAVVLGGKTSKSRDKIMISLLDKGFNKLGRTNSMKLRRIASVPKPKLKPWTDSMVVASSSSGERKKRRRGSLWSIELGGFGKENEVVNAVTNAMDVAPEQLAYSHINFVNRDINGEKSHWARFVSLTEKQARSACKRLLSSDTECKVVDE
jgi:D-alanyl-D-alanine carboxypeptidase